MMNWTGLVRCSRFADVSSLQSRMALVPMPARLTLLHACGQWHSSRVVIASYRYHRTSCRCNTVSVAMNSATH
jgi:hypothetical protein